MASICKAIITYIDWLWDPYMFALELGAGVAILENQILAALVNGQPAY